MRGYVRGLIPYAGFDPDENDFGDVELAPLHCQDIEPHARRYRTALNVDRARHLRGLGWTFDAVGVQLAIEDGRPVAYRGTSIWWALRYATPREVRHADA
jgi:hypothetical protein